MPNGKPDPECNDCNGTGQVVLFTSSKICDCVNRQPSFARAIDAIKNFGDKIDGVYGDFEYMEKDFEIKPIPPPPRKHILQVDPKVLEGLKKLQLSADYIADGIMTWFMWPGIEGHECSGCGAEMNVLGMSYNHWCPLCDPEGKEYVFHSMSHCGRMPFDYPVFGPSIDTIRAGGRLVDARRKERERGSIRDADGAVDGETG